MRRNRNAKIVATVGPATTSPEMLAKLFAAGADVFRFNFSHGSYDDHRARFEAVRALERETKRPIGIMMDLQGPKLRIGTFASGPVEIAAGRRFRLDLDPKPGDATRAHLPHKEIFQALADGTDLLIDDGKLRLRVLSHGPDFAETEVVTGGKISERKGVNVPNVILPLSPITDKDRRDLAFGLELGVDMVALSFVQRPEDVAEARKLIGGRAGVCIKLEKPSAIEHLAELIDMCDAVMVARGDLGVELPPEDVPSIQKRIVRACRESGTPVIVATQMLDSMMASPAPTRAEASDVATAVYDGADAVMLSGETASGSYPVEAVAIMDRIIQRVEHDSLYRNILDAVHPEPEATAADAISAAARQVGHTISAACIATFTMSGSTALRAARERPDVPILGLTAKPSTARKLALLWGVHWVLTHDISTFTEMVQTATEAARTEGLAEPGQRLVITAGVPFGTPGATNVLRIARVGE
ncbi:MAG: pyruvate kinase [Alphaproteobacteria bacterium]|nr:pyruvate kinase [Alphaproteobacteria bacterium]